MLATDTLQLVFCAGVLVILVHTSSAVFVTVYEHLFQHMLQANFVLHQLKACGLSTSIRHVLAPFCFEKNTAFVSQVTLHCVFLLVTMLHFHFS